jgi:hypothetical protein
LLISGRDLHRATALANALGGRATGVMIDHTPSGFAGALRTLGVDLLIHTAGPV